MSVDTRQVLALCGGAWASSSVFRPGLASGPPPAPSVAGAAVDLGERGDFDEGGSPDADE